MKFILVMIAIVSSLQGSCGVPPGTAPADTPLLVRRCNDFDLSGSNSKTEWDKATWTPLNQIDQGEAGQTRFKIMYSDKGIYLMFHGEDKMITSNYQHDFENLFTADVFEVFFHPQPSEHQYFEYEVSPLDKELVLLILNRDGKFAGWSPWPYEGSRKVIKKVTIIGGEMRPGASIKGWTAELFFPYQLLTPMMNVPPVSGMKWNANFCRLDYDSGNAIKWSWSPVKVSFHEYKKYFPILFE
jgi:hypothetical protein